MRLSRRGIIMTHGLELLERCWIETIYINEDKTSIKFKCRHEEFIYYSSGDCCAKLFLEDIEYPPTKPTKDEYGYFVIEVIEVDDYGYKIVTDKGNIVISGRYEDSSGWGGYTVSVSLSSITVHDTSKEIWSEFKEIGRCK